MGVLKGIFWNLLQNKWHILEEGAKVCQNYINNNKNSYVMKPNQLIGNIRNELHSIEEYVSCYYNKQLPSGRPYILNIDTFRGKLVSLRERCLELNEVDSNICSENICIELREIINEDIHAIYLKTDDPEEIYNRMDSIVRDIKRLLSFAL